MTRAPTILVFDSGLGGLTVFREIVKARPDAAYVYVADDAFFPYGHHGEADIIARVVPLIGDLIAAHAPDLVVIACNTASTLVMAQLREAYAVPFVGTVPAIKPACAASQTRRVSVLGTKGTVRREYTEGLIRDFAQGCDVTLVGAAHLASLAEAAFRGEAVTDADDRRGNRAVFVDGENRAHRHRGAGLHPLSAAGRAVTRRWRPGRSTGSTRRPRSRGGAPISSAPCRRAGPPPAPQFIFTSGATPGPVLARALAPFFGGRLLAGAASS